MAGESPDRVLAALTVYTDALVVRGSARVPRAPLAQVLTETPGGVLELYEVTIEEPGARGRPITAPVAHIRTDAILFVLSSRPIEEDAPAGGPSVLLALPPFDVEGRLPTLPADVALRDALREVPRSGFITVMGAAYWSEPLGEGRRRSPVVTVNAAKIHLVVPHREVDPWAGLDQARAPEGGLILDAGPGFDAGRTPGGER